MKDLRDLTDLTKPIGDEYLRAPGSRPRPPQHPLSRPPTGGGAAGPCRRTCAQQGGCCFMGLLLYFLKTLKKMTFLIGIP